MQWILLVTLSIIMIPNVASQESNMSILQQIENIPDDWKLLEVKSDSSEQISYFRKNIGASKLKGNKLLSTLVYFTIKYNSEDASGLPNQIDAQKLYEFEEKIIPKIEKKAMCILVASVVKDGIKDHIFYVSDSELFLSIISSYRGSIEDFEISLEKQVDPSWEIYEDFPDGA